MERAAVLVDTERETGRKEMELADVGKNQFLSLLWYNNEDKTMEARKELLAEIDSTIDQLIENGETLKRISADPQYEVEAAALEKTQESLLAHLMHLQSYLQGKGGKPPKIDPSVKKMMNRPRVRHHKAKRFFTF